MDFQSNRKPAIKQTMNRSKDGMRTELAALRRVNAEWSINLSKKLFSPASQMPPGY